MLLSDKIVVDSSYEIRGTVDGRYVVRIRDSGRNTEIYCIWTEDERAEFHKIKRGRTESADQNVQIYERHLAGDPFTVLAQDFRLSVNRVRQACAAQMQKERRQELAPPLSTKPITDIDLANRA